ncbi:MAG: ECF transporter S component [Eubacteriales bacterium]
MNANIKKLTYTALFIAIVFLCTVVIAIPSPLGGYINIGDAAIYIASFFLGPLYGFLAGGIGSMLGDFSLGYFIYMLPTLIIKGSMGAVSALFFKHNKNVLGICCGLVIMVAGYYVAEIIILNNLFAPMANVPFNLIQGSAGAFAAYLLIQVFKKSKINIS